MPKRSFADLETAEEIEDNFEVKTERDPDAPKITDPGWSDYVMGLFVEGELKDGKPRVHGLRRVSHLLFGEVDDMTSEIVDTPSEFNGRRYVARCGLTIPSVGRFEDVGDCSLDDKKAFSQYPAALALTRAEARVFRKMLKLNVCAAEEITTETGEIVVEDKAEWNPDEESEYATQQQANYITNQCKKLKIDQTKFVKKYGGPGSEDGKLTSAKAAEMIAELNSYMKENGQIPAELKTGKK